MKVLVVGSGPTGVSAAYAAINRGWNVTMIDAGLTSIDNRPTIGSSEPPRKNHEKKDFVYRDFPVGPRIYSHIPKLIYTPSFAAGGLSNVWGASLGMPSDEYFSTIGIPKEQFTTASETVSKFLPRMKLDVESNTSLLVLSRKMLSIYERFKVLKKEDRELPFLIQGAELAISHVDGKNCQFCNMCLIECPYGLVWNAKENLRNLKKLGMTYISGLRLLSISKLGDSMIVGSSIDKLGNEHISDPFNRVFLACGPVEAFRILATSKVVPAIAKLNDTRVFYFASSALGIKRNKKDEERVSLAQLVLTLKNPDNTEFAKIQLYDSSLGQHWKIRNKLKILGILNERQLGRLMNSLVFGIGYLPASYSSSLTLTLNSNNEVELDSTSGEDFNPKILEVKRRLSMALRQLKIPIIPFSFTLGQTGEGFHVGSWINLSDTELATASMEHLPNVHLVDSSAIPRLPLGPITELLMVNAVRIVNNISNE